MLFFEYPKLELHPYLYLTHFETHDVTFSFINFVYYLLLCFYINFTKKQSFFHVYIICTCTRVKNENNTQKVRTEHQLRLRFFKCIVKFKNITGEKNLVIELRDF